jgi:hypothetical protein
MEGRWPGEFGLFLSLVFTELKKVEQVVEEGEFVEGGNRQKRQLPSLQKKRL